MVGRIIGVTFKSIAIVLGFALGLALALAGLFFVGVPLIIFCIWLYVRLIKKERERTREEQDAKGITPVNIPTEKPDNSDENAVNIPKNNGNPVAEAAAAYFIGKAVTDKMNQSAKKTTSYSKYRERVEKAQKEAMEKPSLLYQGQVASKVKVKLADGRGGYLYTMLNGNQQLVNFSGRTIARYDKMYNRTTEGNTKVIGKRNLISNYLS